MHLKCVSWELDWLFPMWKSDGREGTKTKTKTELIGLLLFYGWTSLGVSLFKVYPTKYCWNLRARRPQVSVQIPKHVETWQPPGDWIPRQIKAGQPPENWIPGQVEAYWPPGTPGMADSWAGWGVITSQGPDPQADWGRSTSWTLGWWIPKQAEAWQPPGDQISRQFETGQPPGTPRLELGIPKVSSMTSTG